VDLLFIKILAFISLKSSEELIELSVDEFDDFWLFQPDEERSTHIFKVQGTGDIITSIAALISSLAVHTFSHHSHSLLSDLLVYKFILFIFIV
jgi:hypothetical protein